MISASCARRWRPRRSRRCRLPARRGLLPRRRLPREPRQPPRASAVRQPRAYAQWVAMGSKLPDPSAPDARSRYVILDVDAVENAVKREVSRHLAAQPVAPRHSSASIAPRRRASRLVGTLTIPPGTPLPDAYEPPTSPPAPPPPAPRPHPQRPGGQWPRGRTTTAPRPWEPPRRLRLLLQSQRSRPHGDVADRPLSPSTTARGSESLARPSAPRRRPGPSSRPISASTTPPCPISPPPT